MHDATAIGNNAWEHLEIIQEIIAYIHSPYIAMLACMQCYNTHLVT